MKLISNEVEAAEAVRNILGSRGSDDKKKPRKVTGLPTPVSSHQGHPQPQHNPLLSHVIPTMPNPQPAHQFHPIQQHRIYRNGDSLQKSAEEILAGIKRPTAVEGAVVQFLLPEKQPQSGKPKMFKHHYSSSCNCLLGEGWKTQNILGKRIYQTFDPYQRPNPVNNPSTTMAINLSTMPSYQVAPSHGVPTQHQNNLTFCTMEQVLLKRQRLTSEF